MGMLIMVWEPCGLFAREARKKKAPAVDGARGDTCDLSCAPN